MEEETGDIESILYHGRGEPGASVHVHMPGILAQWVGVDGARKLVITYWETNTLEKNRSTTI